MNEQTTEGGTEERAGGFRWWAVGVGALIAAIAVGGSVWMVRTSPRAARRPPEAKTPVVELGTSERTVEAVVLEVMGTVMPARELSLQAEVSARVVWIHPQLVEGGRIRAGEELLRLDDTMYRAALMRQRAALKTAKSNLRIEEGRQAVAKADWEHMQEVAPGLDADQALAMREPQLAAAQAAVESAQAVVEEAEYDVTRTTITAPFDAVVLSEDTEVGAQARPGSVLARLVGTDSFWVRAVVPVSQLPWIELPSEAGAFGAAATVLLPDGGEREGVVRHRLPDIEADARMARVLVEVPDPLGLAPVDGPPRDALLLNDFVRVMIRGFELDDVCRIPRAALRGGRELWLLDADRRLRILPVKVVWGNRDYVLVRGEWDAASRLIVSDLAAPVEGMALRIADEPTAPGGEGEAGRDGAPGGGPKGEAGDA